MTAFNNGRTAPRRTSALEETIRLMADERGEIAMTTNTRSVIEEAMAADLVRPVSGKFRCVEPGCLNSVYRLVQL